MRPVSDGNKSVAYNWSRQSSEHQSSGRRYHIHLRPAPSSQGVQQRVMIAFGAVDMLAGACPSTLTLSSHTTTNSVRCSIQVSPAFRG
jgi:hypothetical protein